jgi:hypothetical protein
MTCFLKCSFYIHLVLIFFKIRFEQCLRNYCFIPSRKKLLCSFKGTRFPLSGWAQSTCARNYILVQNLSVTLFTKCDNCIPSWGSWAHFPDLQSFHVCLVWCYLPSYARRFPKRSLRLKPLALNYARIDHFAKMWCVSFLHSVDVVLFYGISEEHQVVGLCYVPRFALT